MGQSRKKKKSFFMKGGEVFRGPIYTARKIGQGAQYLGSAIGKGAQNVGSKLTHEQSLHLDFYEFYFAVNQKNLNAIKDVSSFEDVIDKILRHNKKFIENYKYMDDYLYLKKNNLLQHFNIKPKDILKKFLIENSYNTDKKSQIIMLFSDGGIRNALAAAAADAAAAAAADAAAAAASIASIASAAAAAADAASASGGGASGGAAAYAPAASGGGAAASGGGASDAAAAAAASIASAAAAAASPAAAAVDAPPVDAAAGASNAAASAAASPAAAGVATEQSNKLYEPLVEFLKAAIQLKHVDDIYRTIREIIPDFSNNRILESTYYNEAELKSKLKPNMFKIKKQRKEAGKLFFEELINFHTLSYGTDFDDIEKAKYAIADNKPRNQQIILFLDNFKIKDKLAKEYMDTQTGYFQVFNSDIFDLKKELEFLELNKLKKMEKEIEKMQKTEDMNEITAKIDGINRYLNILQEKQKKGEVSENVKKELEKQREILINDPKLKEAMKVRLLEKINTQEFNQDMKEKMMKIAEKEGYIIAMEYLIELAKEQASQDIALQKLDSKTDFIESDADYKENKQKLINLLVSNEIEFKKYIENKLISNPELLKNQILLINEMKKKQYELTKANAEADAARAAVDEADAAAARAAANVAVDAVTTDLENNVINTDISKFPEFVKFKTNFKDSTNNDQKIYIAYIETLNNLTEKKNTTPEQSGGSKYISDNESISDDENISDNESISDDENISDDEYISHNSDDEVIGGINNSYKLLGGAPKLQVDKRNDSFSLLKTSLNFTEEDFYNLTHYYIEITWPIYVILKMFIKKNSLIKSFMNNYINKIFGLTNNKKLNAIKSSPDAYRSISNILINEVFFDIIQNNISDIKNYKDKDYEEIEKELIGILENENETIEKLDKKNTAFMKLSFNQSELIKYLVDSFDNIANLGKIINKEGGIEKIRTMYSEKIKKILNIIESEEDVREKFNYITDDLNSIFNLQGTNILKPYRDTIKNLDKAIDDFEGPINSVLIEELFKSYLPSFVFDNNKITIEFDNIEFNDTLQGKQLEAITQKINQREKELINLKKLLKQTGDDEEE